MEVNKLLKNVNSLNKYIAVTHDICNNYTNAKIQFNMSSVLALKKICSFEIEYFKKSEDNGAACMIFERMLNTPPSKTWNILGKELINLLQYWLDAIRKHLISHSMHWWTFLKLLLRFIKDIRTKDSTIPNLLVELTAECLLDVATNDRVGPSQRRDVLACLNMFCAESGREIRFVMRTKLESYFVKLSWYMCTCGHVPCQYSALETLVRWLLPRHEPAVRLAAADKWLPLNLCSHAARDVFLKRPWMDFFQDAREFLNAHNNSGNDIKSVVIKKLTIGPIVVITGTEKRETWIDINTAQNCLSVLLMAKVLEAIGVAIDTSCEALVISCDDVENATFTRYLSEVVISLRALHTPRMTSSFKIADDNDDKRNVTIVITSRCDLKDVDKALRAVFRDKYQLLLNLDKELPLSPENTRNFNESGEDTRLSYPAEIRGRKHSGIVRVRYPSTWKSPSTASTSSLAHLHEKLAALPRYTFEKQQVSVCVKPELSIVAELSETADKYSLNTSTHRLCPNGVRCKRKSESHGESVKCQSKTRNVSPAVNENAPSTLLVATIGSDESVINETLERLAKNKDYISDNIVDLLVQEALQSKQMQEEDKLLDSGINSAENKKTQELDRIVEAIDYTPCEDIPIKAIKTPCTVISRSTSDESNTEVVNETPDYVSVRGKSVKHKAKQLETEKKYNNSNEITFDVKAVDDFFSQHFIENRAGEIVVSPTLARKINETSSEFSDFENNYLIINDDLNANVENIETDNNIDIIDCLNSIVDNVCIDFDKCTEYLNLENDDIVKGKATETPLQEIKNTVEMKSKVTAKKPRKSTKKEYKVASNKDKPKQKVTAKKRNHKLEKTKMSTIVEDSEIITVMNTNNEEVREGKGRTEPERKIATPENKETAGRSMHRKRKLYSPKDTENKVDTDNQITYITHTKENDEDIPPSEVKIITRTKTPKSTATCYKEIEKERSKRVRQPRKRIIISSTKIPSPSSPKTHKKPLKGVESNENITIADKMRGKDVFNFSNDSEDNDFKMKKIQKRNSTTTIGSLESTVSTRQSRRNRVNYSENISSNDDNIKKKGAVRRKKVVKQRNSKNKINIESEVELVDERLRQAVPEDLNTSLITVEKKRSVNIEPELLLEKVPEMEIIPDDGINEKSKVIQKKRTNKKNKKNMLNALRVIAKAPASEKITLEDDVTFSPLPGLVVETMHRREVDEMCSLSTNMLQKYKKIYKEGPDAYINESNTTQNLHSDIEKNNISTNKIFANVVDITGNEHLEYNPTINLIKDENFHNIRPINLKEHLETDSSNSRIKSVKSYKPKKPTLKNTDRNVQRIEPTTISDNSQATRRSVSIATVDITGHGDLDESPPDLNLMQEKFKPRNLSIADFDQSMKDYYVNLTNAIYQCDDTHSNIVKTPENNPKMNSDSIKSPVVTIQRLSFNDISKLLPSRSNSESVQNSSNDYNSVKMISQPSSKSGKVMVKNKSKETNHTSEKTEILKRANVVNIPKITSRSCIPDSDKNASEKNTEIESIVTSSKKRVDDSKVNRKSMISPIKLFDDFQPNDNAKSDSSDDENLKKIRNIFSKNKCTQRSKKSENKEESCILVSESSTSAEVYRSSKRVVKRSPSPVEVEVKKKAELNNSEEIVSGPSTSTVNDWLKGNEPTGSRTEGIHASFSDSIQYVMEKLDTTLEEIHASTSKQFVHLFVDAQTQLTQMKEERRSMYKEMTTDITKIMDKKFADFEIRSQEMDSNFIRQLKVQATEFIREDCKRKHAMVLLLKEDVQSVTYHINKNRRSESP